MYNTYSFNNKTVNEIVILRILKNENSLNLALQNKIE